MPWGPSTEFADWWYVISWKGLIWAGVATALAAAATVGFAVVQFWADDVRDKRSGERQLTLEMQTSEAKRETTGALERIAVLQAEAEKLKAQAEADRLARIKIEERIAPRRISSEQRTLLAQALTKLPKGAAVVESRLMDNEGKDFADDLKAALADLGWNVVAGTFATWTSSERGLFLGVVADQANAKLVSDALATAGLKNAVKMMAPTDQSRSGGFEPGILYFLVGAKP